MIRVIVLAPALAVRAGLRAILSADKKIDVLAEAATLAAPHALPQHADVIITVPQMLNEPELAAFLEDSPVPPALLLLSDETTDAAELRRLPLRAWGLLPLITSEEDLVTAVYSLQRGLITIDPALIQPLMDTVLSAPDEDLIVEELTEREMEVLELLAEGLANKQIALELEISEHTVKFHVSSIYSKLGATNRTEAVMTGARLGLIVL